MPNINSYKQMLACLVDVLPPSRVAGALELMFAETGETIEAINILALDDTHALCEWEIPLAELTDSTIRTALKASLADFSDQEPEATFEVWYQLRRKSNGTC